MSTIDLGGTSHGPRIPILPIAGNTTKLAIAEANGCRKCGGCDGDNRCGRQTNVGHQKNVSTGSALLDAPDHVLSTLEKDGSRRWLWPRLAKGRYWNRRRWFGYALIAFFVTLPHLRYAGKPPLLLDIPARQLTVMGHTFLPTDTLLLALGMVCVFLTIMATTTLTGRVWCGWACPQTVYTEFLFRPIDRFFDGTKGRGGRPKQAVSGPLAVARYAIYLLFSMALAHTFLSYFVGTDKLAMWIQSSPMKHPFAFAVMGATTIAMLYDFLFFREQLCLIACPYGRFQSVMLDRKSLIVGYDEKRGEPRGRLKKSKSEDTGLEGKTGDCVDCNLCVAVCPTGIDIRNGLQMECINCTQCIDACDSVMDKIGKPRGLIRYSSQDGLSGKSSAKIRPRIILYPTLLAVVFSAFLFVLSTKSSFDVSIIRGGGNPYTSIAIGQVQNSMKLRLVNRSDSEQVYRVELLSPEGAKLEVMEPEKLTMKVGQNNLIPLSLSFPARLTGQGGHTMATLLITDSQNRTRELTCQLLGPKQ
jgi:cytochrome c oxidase accessory protein FixG